jgi:hypothetical protein
LNFFHVHPYSPNLAPSVYFTFGPINEALDGRKLASADEDMDVVSAWLGTQQKLSS